MGWPDVSILAHNLHLSIRAPMADMEALIIGGAGALIAVWGVITQRVIARRRATLDFLSNSEADGDLIDARQKFIELAKAPGGLAPWADPDKEKSDETQHIRTVLNEYELIAIGIQHGIVDFAIYKKWHASGVLKYWEYAHPFIAQLRSRTQNKTLFHEFEQMVKWLEKKPDAKSFALVGTVFLDLHQAPLP